MDATAVVLEKPEDLRIRAVELVPAGSEDVVVDIHYSGISTGTERLLFTGEMPPFPGMGYPLVPGYESVGVVREAGPDSGRREGDLVFVPGARCFKDVHGLFGGAASQLVVPGSRVAPLPPRLGEASETGVLLALAATAYHALRDRQGRPAPVDLVVGHGVLGRLVARVNIALGYAPPVVWERDAERMDCGDDGYRVVHAEDDKRTDYHRICDVSGNAALLDTLISRLHHGGEIVLAGFYSERISFSFPPAFMREAHLQIAAQWLPEDLAAVSELLSSEALSLEGLITHRSSPDAAPSAYRTAFGDPSCLKMVLDWRTSHG